MIGRSAAEFGSNEDELKRFLEADRHVIDTRTELLIPESKVTDATGRVRWHQTVKVPLIEPDGSCDKVLGVSTDITARKQADEELRKRTAQIVRKHAALQELALATHENVDRTLEKIALVAARAIGSDQTGVLLFNDDRTLLRWKCRCRGTALEAVAADKPELDSARFPSYLEVLQTSRSLAVEDSSTDAVAPSSIQRSWSPSASARSWIYRFECAAAWSVF